MTAIDQAQRLREIMEEAEPAIPAASRHAFVEAAVAERRARVIAVASGKGGVGKTNVAINLSICLSAMGRRVALVDLDMGMANVDLLCGLNRPHNISHVISGRRRLEDVTLEAPGGFLLVPGASGVSELADIDDHGRERLITDLSNLERDCDTLILDVSAGISAAVLAFAAVADTTLIVTTPEPTAITDGYGLIKSMVKRGSHAELALLVNQVESETQGRRVFDRMSTVCRRFLQHDLSYAGSIPFDPVVKRAVQRQHPFALSHPGAPASRATARLCHLLDRSVRTGADHLQTSGYFRRWLNRLVSRRT